MNGILQVKKIEANINALKNFSGNWKVLTRVRFIFPPLWHGCLAVVLPSTESWPLTGRLALAEMTEINPKKRAVCVICAKLDPPSGLWEALEVLGERGCGCQGQGQLETALGWESVTECCGQWSQHWGGIWCSKSSPQLLGSLTTEQAGHRLGDVFLELYIATCANLLELVN